MATVNKSCMQYPLIMLYDSVINEFCYKMTILQRIIISLFHGKKIREPQDFS